MGGKIRHLDATWRSRWTPFQGDALQQFKLRIIRFDGVKREHISSPATNNRVFLENGLFFSLGDIFLFEIFTCLNILPK
jgi:hypothetical protein